MQAVILEHNPGGSHRSLIVNVNASLGQFVGRDPNDESVAVLNPVGHQTVGVLMRRVDSTAPLLADLLLLGAEGMSGLTPSRDDIPVRTGEAVDVEPVPNRAEYEGTTYLWQSGTGNLGAVAVGDTLSVYLGRLREAQGGDLGPLFRVTAVLTPVDDATATRVRVQRVLI